LRRIAARVDGYADSMKFHEHTIKTLIYFRPKSIALDDELRGKNHPLFPLGLYYHTIVRVEGYQQAGKGGN